MRILSCAGVSDTLERLHVESETVGTVRVNADLKAA